MIDLTELERSVLTKLLAGEHPVLEQLRSQLRSCRVVHREMTGHGFFAQLDVGNTSASLDVNVSFGDVAAEISGMTQGAGFELLVKNGRLITLEGYGYDDPWPSAITGYTLKYITYGIKGRSTTEDQCEWKAGGTTGDQRDWAELGKELKRGTVHHGGKEGQREAPG